MVDTEVLEIGNIQRVIPSPTVRIHNAVCLARLYAQ
jgi:hypothetical protein